MRIEDPSSRYETVSSADMERLRNIYDRTIARQHKDSDEIRSLAAQGPLVSGAQEMELQGLADGSRPRGTTLAEEMRTLLGMATTTGVAEVGQRTHDGEMAGSSASKFASLTEALKDLLAEREAADALVDVSQDQDNLLDADEDHDATANSGQLQSEVEFLRAELEKLQRQYAAERAMKDNKFSSRGGAQTNRTGIGA